MKTKQYWIDPIHALTREMKTKRGRVNVNQLTWRKTRRMSIDLFHNMLGKPGTVQDETITRLDEDEIVTHTPGIYISKPRK